MSKATVLGVSYDEYKKKTTVRLVICMVVLLAVVAINIALYYTVTRQTKIVFTIINSVLDIAYVWFILYYGITVLSMRYKLLRIYRKADKLPSEINGVIVGISAWQKVFGFDCVTVTLEIEDGIRKIFVIEDNFKDMICAGKSARFILADNIAIECEVDDEK